MTGDYPGNARKRKATLRAVDPLESEAAMPALVDINGVGNKPDPSAIRPALAQLAAANLDALQRALLEAALSATTTRWAMVACDDCGARSRVELPVPDVRSRLQAIETLLAQGLGRPGQADEPAVARMPTHAASVQHMSWADMQGLAGAILTDELAIVADRGGQELLRQRIAALSDGERRVLRDALAEAV